jgi:hypothetical protein
MTLLAELARVLRLVDPMPPRVLRDARAAGLALRAPDSLVVQRETVSLCRSAGRRVRVGTASGETVLDVEIRELGDTTRVAGLVRTGVRVSHDGTELDVDEGGYVNAEVTGPVRLTVTWPDGRTGDTGPL